MAHFHIVEVVTCYPVNTTPSCESAYGGLNLTNADLYNILLAILQEGEVPSCSWTILVSSHTRGSFESRFIGDEFRALDPGAHPAERG